jgi:hypothetical protein
MSNKTSQHILATAANLLGFCLIIVTSLHLTNQTDNIIIDEFTSMVALLLTISSILSFISIKSQNLQRKYRAEQIADYIFLVSLVGIFGIVVSILVTMWL